MANIKKTVSKKEVINAAESMETKAPKKQVSDNTLNKDGFVKGKALTPKELAEYQAKHK